MNKLLSLVALQLFFVSAVFAAEDYGDAPVSYGVVSHTDGNPSIFLGNSAPDTEAGMQHSLVAYGDDGGDCCNDDEDSVPRIQGTPPGSDYWKPNLLPLLVETATSYSVPIEANNGSGAAVNMRAWIDFDHSGTFDDDEVSDLISVPDGAVKTAPTNLTWSSIPPDIDNGTAYIRIRITSDALGVTDDIGNKSDGEVEDHTIGIAIVPEDTLDIVARIEIDACQTVAFEDNFDDESNGDSWSSASLNPDYSPITNWTDNGGGEDTYALIQGDGGGGGSEALYFGNGNIRRISPSVIGGLTFDAIGNVTTVIQGVEIRDAADDYSSGPGVWGGQGGTAHHGPDPLELSTTFTTLPNTVYQLNWSSKSESGPRSGFAGVRVPGGSALFEIPGPDGASKDFTMFFTSGSGTSSTVTFINYGHIGNDFCKPGENASCTLEGSDTYTSELILDNVSIYQNDTCGGSSAADLGITKDDGVTSADVGDTLTYTLTITNNGPDASGSGLTLVDTLTNTVTVNNGAAGPLSLTGADAANWVCGSDAATPQVISCTWTGAGTGMASTTTNTIAFETDALVAGLAGSTVTNTVEVIPDPAVTDSDSGNNTDSHETPVSGSLLAPTLTKDITPEGIEIGGTSTMTLVISNPNTSALSGVGLTDTYPAGMLNATGVLSNTCGGTLIAANGTNSAVLTGGAIAASSSCTMTLEITSSTVGAVTNTTGPVTSNEAPNSAPASDDLSVLAAAVVSTEPGAATCTSGTPDFSTSLVSNGDFSTLNGGPQAPGGLISGSFTSGVPYSGDDIYPVDTTISIQDGTKFYFGGIVQQNVFPGDPANSVAASDTYLYANGNTTGGPYVTWSQNVTVTPNTEYLFVAYVTNLIRPGTDLADDPIVTFYVDGSQVGTTYTVIDETDGVDRWTRVTRSFTTGPAQVSALLELRDAAVGSSGDDLGITAVGGFECVVDSPEIGISKVVSGAPTLNADGSFNVTFDMIVENTGDVTLNTLTLVDDMSVEFGTAFVSYVTPPTLALVNTSGNSVIPTAGALPNIFSGTDGTLAVGDQITITGLVVTLDANAAGAPNPLENVATVGGTPPGGGAAVMDESNDGTDPTAGSGGPVDPTPVTPPTPAPEIGISKVLSGTPTLNADGSFNATFDMIVENTGNVTLNTLTLVDDMATQFGSAFVAYVTPPTLALVNTSGNSVIPTAGTLPNIFSGTDGTLAVGDLITITGLVVTLDANMAGAPSPLENVATVGGTPPGGGTPVSDDSNDGTDPTAGAGGPVDPTPVPPPGTNPEIGLSKVLSGTPTLNADGSFNATFDMIVENTGDVTLDTLTLVDDMATLFGSAFVAYVTSPTLALVNTSGDSVLPSAGTLPNIFSGTDGALAVGDQITITGLVVTLDGNVAGAPNPFLNVATVGGTPPGGGTPVADDSNDGTDPTAGAGGPVDPTPVVPPTTNPEIGIAKVVNGEPVSNGDGTFNVTFDLVVENTGDVPLSSLTLVDDMATQFGSAFVAYVGTPTIALVNTSGNSTAPTAGTLPSIFSGTDGTLAVGDQITITGLVVTLDANASGAPDPLLNVATVGGTPPGGGTPVSDDSNDGTDPTDGPGGPVDPTPVELPALAALTGTVWLDASGDNIIDPQETLLGGWTVNVLDANGNVILDANGNPATAVTDGNGFYSIPDLPPGSYTVEFVSPNGVTFAQEGVTLPVNVTVDVPLPIDPSGVVYDAVTRQPVAGATLTFIDDSTGLPVPPQCLLPGQQNQVTSADGNYRFDLILDAPAGSNPGCPTGGDYTIVVVPPTGYTFESAIIPVETGSLDAATCPIDAVPGTICEVQAQDTAPQIGDSTIYYLSFTLNPGVQDVINNHIPLDPPPANILLTKSANKSEVMIGDLVQYTLEATNDSGLVGISNAQVVDNLPAGFAYVDNTAVAIQAGLDGVFGTGDDVTSSLGLFGTSTDPITLVSLNFAPSETILIRYLVSVGTGVSSEGGDYINVAQITDPFGNELSNIATAAVRVIKDPMLEETTIIGKVWHDRDTDGYQDNADATGIKVGSDYFGWNSLTVDDLPGRIRETDPVSEHQTVVRMPYNPSGDNSFRVSTKEGTVINVDNSGNISTDHTGLMARGMTAQDIRVEVAKGSGKPSVVGNQVVAPAAAGNEVLNITITNHGIHEEGIPGVRLATVEGLLIETDQFGRYHVAGVDTGHFSHGTNYIIKVDDATLPEGSVFTTENPRVQRLTTALMTRFNFGVDLPDLVVPAVAACEQQYEMVSEGGTRVEPRSLSGLIDPVRFESGKSQIPANYAAQLESLINSHSDKQNLRVRFIGHTDNERLSPATAAKYGTNQGLSEARARMVADVVMQGLSIDSSAVLTEGRADTQPLASNSTRAGMAQNRRVEIELVYDEVIDDTRTVRKAVGPACNEPAPQMVSETVTDYVTQSLGNVVEPVRFASGKSQIPVGYVEQLRDVMAGLSDKQNLRLRFTGHTDNERLAPSTKAKYGTNQGLSEARAKMVADNMASQLGLSGNQVDIAGFGDTQPVASNSTRDGMALNRRVEVEVLYDEAITRTINAAPAPMASVAKSATLPHGGVIWATEDPGKMDPRLDIMASGPLVVDGSSKIAPIDFSVYSNYQAYIETYKISLYHENDTDLVRPVSELVGKTPRFDQPISWDGYLQNEGRPQAGEHLVYVLEVSNASGHTDRTAPQLLRVIDAEIQVHEDESNADRTYGGNSLAQQNIPIHGSKVRLHGKDIDRNYTLMINDQQVQIGEDNNFVYEQHLPMGDHRFDVKVSNAGGQTWDRSVDVNVDSDYLFIVAMANLTMGENDTSGDLSPLNGDHHFDGSEWVDGRIAAYMKGKVGGKYLVTAQIDTTEDDIDNLGDNLSRKDGSSVFRRLDADDYYATYGDDSTTVSDVDTQGAFYLRVDWDNNKALWGNYNTQITGNEFAQYNRSLYGAQFVHESLKTNDHGDNQSAVYAFASEAQTASAHNEYLATGGSLYYLRETDIVRGSEKVWVEVRSRDSQRVVDLIPMEEGRDYQIDYLQGRIILNRPLAQVAGQSAQSIIRDQALEGDDVILAVDYEYQPQGFTGDDLSAGIRGKGWLGNAIGVGATYITEDRDNAADYTLSGVDVTLKAGKGTWLKAEYAESESVLGNGWLSRNGGLSFASVTAANSGQADGEAISLEGQINFADMSDSDLNARINAWYKDRDAGFSSTRINDGIETTDMGIEASYQSDAFSLTARANQLEQNTATTFTANLQAAVGVSDHWSVIGELRYEDADQSDANLGFSGNGDALLGALGLKYRVNEHTDIWGSLQSVLEDSGNYSDNDAFILGARSQLSEHLAMMAEVSSGDRGDALNLGIDWSVNDNLNLQIEGGFGDVARSQVGSTFTTAGGLELYGSYAVDTDRTDNEQQRLTFGQAQRYGDGSRLYAEQQFTNDKAVSGITHIFGVDHRLTEQMGISASLQSSSLENGAGDVERTAGSVGFDYRDGNRLKASARLEYREDTGAENTTQWLTTNALDWQQNDHLRWVARLNLSMTENDNTGLDDGKFIEGDIGFAYRPASNDRLNILGKYTYLYDLPASLSTGFFTGQNDSSTDQKMHVFSLEALYDLTRKWELGAKIASRQSQTRALRGSGAWFDSGATLAAIRARYHMVHNWDALAEYHIMSSEAGDDERHGALLALYRHVGSNFKIGIGYNFTDFSDDLTNTSYDADGFFIDLTGKY